MKVLHYFNHFLVCIADISDNISISWILLDWSFVCFWFPFHCQHRWWSKYSFRVTSFSHFTIEKCTHFLTFSLWQSWYFNSHCTSLCIVENSVSRDNYQATTLMFSSELQRSHQR
jgi:hypothetical protein